MEDIFSSNELDECKETMNNYIMIYSIHIAFHITHIELKNDPEDLIGTGLYYEILVPFLETPRIISKD